jgi:hypothetical protein
LLRATFLRKRFSSDCCDSPGRRITLGKTTPPFYFELFAPPYTNSFLG